MKTDLVLLGLGIVIGLWLGIRIGKGLAVLSLGHDIWNKLK